MSEKLCFFIPWVNDVLTSVCFKLASYTIAAAHVGARIPRCSDGDPRLPNASLFRLFHLTRLFPVPIHQKNGVIRLAGLVPAPVSDEVTNSYVSARTTN